MNTLNEELILKQQAHTGSLLIDLMDTIARLSAVGFVNNNTINIKAVQTAFLNMLMFHLDANNFKPKDYLELQEHLVNKYINIMKGDK